MAKVKEKVKKPAKKKVMEIVDENGDIIPLMRLKMIFFKKQRKMVLLTNLKSWKLSANLI